MNCGARFSRKWRPLLEIFEGGFHFRFRAIEHRAQVGESFHSWRYITRSERGEKVEAMVRA